MKRKISLYILSLVIKKYFDCIFFKKKDSLHDYHCWYRVDVKGYDRKFISNLLEEFEFVFPVKVALESFIISGETDHSNIILEFEQNDFNTKITRYFFNTGNYQCSHFQYPEPSMN